MIINESEENKDMFANFDFWTKIHYYAFKNRKSCPNLFFHYFSSEGIVNEAFSKDEVNAVLTNMKKYEKKVNGMWGYLSLLLEKKNGIAVYKMINGSAYYNHYFSSGCIQDGAFFSKEIKEKVEFVFRTKEEDYKKIEKDFEEYLRNDMEGYKERDYVAFIEKYEEKLLFTYSKTGALNLLKNELDYSYTIRRENCLAPSVQSKKKRIITDDMEVEAESVVSNSRNSLNTRNTKLAKNSNNNIRPVQKILPGLNYIKTSKREQIKKFLFSSSSGETSSLEDTSVNETIFSSPNKNFVSKEYNPSYVFFEQSNGYISDNGRKIFTSEKKKYASDDEELKSDEKLPNKQKKVLIFKSSQKKIKNNIDTFSMDNSEIKRLKKDLLNKKTRRDNKYTFKRQVKVGKKLIFNENQSNNINNIPNPRRSKTKHNKSNFYVEDEYEQSSSKKQKLKNAMVSNIIDEDIKISKRNYYVKDDAKSTISSVSNVSSNSLLTRHKKAKDVAVISSVKNFFSLHYDKNHPLMAQNSKVESRFLNKSTRSIHNDIALNNKSSSGSILSYFPQLSNVNTKREGEIVKNLCRLINNSKYQELLHVLDKDINSEYFRTMSKISSITSRLMNESNDIDFELLETVYKSEMEYEFENQKFDFKNDFQNSFKNVLQVYKENLNQFLDHFSKEENSSNKKPEKDIIATAKDVKIAENLLKDVIKNHDKISSTNNITSLSIKSEISEIFLIFLTKLFNQQEDCYADILIERLVSFMMIIKVIFTTFSLQMIKDNTINFIKMTVYIALVKLYGFNMNNLKEKEDQMIYISLVSILNEVYYTLIGGVKNTNANSVFQLIKLVFKEYLYDAAAVNMDLQTSDVKSNFMEISRKIFKGNFLESSTFEKTLKCSLYKIFIMLTNKIVNLSELSENGKKFIFNPLYIQLYHRYFNLFFLMFIESLKPQIKNELESVTIFSHIDEFYSVLSQNSYYDLDNILKSVDSIELKRVISLETKGNLLRKYLLSDSNTILIFDDKWRMDCQSKLKIIFKLFGSIGNSTRKNIIADDEINKKNLYSLLDHIFDNESSQTESSVLNEFLLNICKIIRNTLTKYETDDKVRKRTLSRFICLLSEHKYLFEIAQQANVYENKLGIIPVFAIVLSLIEFTNLFETNDNIELCVKKISEILDFNKTSTLFKGFNIAILLRIIIKFSKKKMDISNYVKYINSNVGSVVNLFNELDKLPNLENNDKNKEEHSRTLEYFLKNFLKISKDDPSLIINNSVILDEMKNIVSSINMNKSLKRMVFLIIENAISKFETIVEESNKRNDTLVLEEEGLELNFNELFDDSGVYELNEKQEEFLKRLRNNFLTIMSCMINSFFQPMNSVNSNVHSRQKISLELLQTICEVYPQLSAILYKYSLIKLSDFLVLFSYNSLFFSNIQIHKENQEAIAFIPFKAFSIFLNHHPKIISDLLNKKDYIHLQHFITMFFFSTLYTFSRFGSKNAYGFRTIRSYNNENVNFMQELMKQLRDNEYLIEDNLNSVKLEFEGKPTEALREQASYYNILLFFIRNYHFIEKITTCENLSHLDLFFFNLLELTSTNKNVNKIDTKFLFKLLIGIEEIINRNILFDQENKLFYANSIRNIFLRILNKFKIDFINYKLDDNTLNFIRKFTKFTLIDNFSFGVNNVDIDFSLLYNKDMKEFVSTVITFNKTDKNKEIVNVYLNEYFKLMKEKVNIFSKDSCPDLSYFNDVPYNLVILEYIPQLLNANMSVTEYFFIVNAVFDEIIKLDEIETISELMKKLIGDFALGMERFKLNQRSDLSLKLHSLIIDKILDYMEVEAELNDERNITSIIDNIFSIVAIEINHLGSTCNKNMCRRSKRLSEYENVNNQITKVEYIREYIQRSYKLIQILREFYFDNPNKKEDLLMMGYLIRDISNSINVDRNIFTKQNNLAIDEYI